MTHLLPAAARFAFICALISARVRALFIGEGELPGEVHRVGEEERGEGGNDRFVPAK